MNAAYKKLERLKSKKEIELLFEEGKSIANHPIRLVYRKTEFKDSVTFRTGVSVGKKYFKNAVDRNHVKRLIRECYRKNKFLIEASNDQYAFMFLYSSKEIPEFALVEVKIKEILQKFVKKELK